MRNKIRIIINRWLIGPLFYFYCVIKDKIYKLFRLWPTDGWQPIETEEDFQELLDQLNDKCGAECKEQPSS